MPLFTGKIDETFVPEVPPHACEEVDTAELLKFMIAIRYVAPVKIQGRVCGALVVNRCSAI